MEAPRLTEQPETEQHFYSDKLKRAAHLLFFKRGRIPGAREWELKARLGRNYEEILDDFNRILNDLDLEVKRVREEAPNTLTDPISTDQEPEDRFLVRLRSEMTLSESRLCGWRIDNLAALAMTIALVISKQGKAPRDEVERSLSQKLGRWQSMNLVDIFIRTGYVREDETGLLRLGWRTKSEVDLKALMSLLLEMKSEPTSSSE
jgi:hypothetical protein